MRSLLFLLLLLAGKAFGQSIDSLRAELRACPEKAGSVYLAYPRQQQKEYTPAPEGYELVYISHYGRHGSRWITEDKRYLYVLDALDGHALTSFGQELRQRLEPVWQDAQGRGGELTALGEQQHHDIAQRMAQHFPSLFNNNARVRVHSSTVRRCMMSMMAFCEGLKELSPGLHIERSASERDMAFICYDSPELKSFTTEWKRDVFAPYRSAHIHPERLMSSIFLHPADVPDPLMLMEELYWIAENMQDVCLGLDFFDLFTPDELFDIWRTVNCRMHVTCTHPLAAASAQSLLDHIIASADSALATGSVTATFRFGHDSSFLRLLARMGLTSYTPSLDSILLAWQDFRLSPMAANLQLIFYRNSAGNVLVKLLLNEKEVALPLDSPTSPYYDWERVKSYWKLAVH